MRPRHFIRRAGQWVDVSAEEFAAHQSSVVRPPSSASEPSALKKGLGDLVEQAVKPIAKAIHHPCLQADDTLRPGSPCHKIKTALNRVRLPGS